MACTFLHEQPHMHGTQRACLVQLVNSSCITYTSQSSLVEQKEALIHHLQVVWLPASSVPALGNTQVHFVWLPADTSILHHAFLSIFIALWAVITHYVTILMPILS